MHKYPIARIQSQKIPLILLERMPEQFGIRPRSAGLDPVARPLFLTDVLTLFSLQTAVLRLLVLC